MSINCEIFISYSSKEKDIASLVRETLENNGITCWMAPESIPASSGYAAEITEAIANAKVVVLVLSSPSMESRWVAKEVDFAICENKPIIPFHIDDSKLTRTFQLYLNNVQHNDAYRRIKLALGDLLDNVTALIGKKTEDAARIHLKPSYREPNGSFCGREAELSELTEAFRDHGVVALSGIGGIGKSEIAKAYACRAYREARYEIVSYADYKGSLRATVAQLDFSNFDEASFLEGLAEREDVTSIEEELFKKKRDWLETHTRSALLIIDGMDDLDDPDLPLLSTLSVNVLLTTRCHFGDIRTVRVSPIGEDTLLDLFYTLYEDGDRESEEEVETVKRILSLVSYHTLTVKLMAQFLKTSGYTPAMLLEALGESTLSKIFDDDEVVHENTYRSISAHIRQLFSLARLTHEEETVLCELSLLPPSGIRKYTFRSWHTSPDTMTVVARLTDRGFIESGHGMIALHPLVAAVVKEELRPSTERCLEFLEGMIAGIEDEVIPTLRQMDEISAITLSAVAALSEESLTMVRLLTSVGRFHGTYAYNKLMPLKSYRGMNLAFGQLRTDSTDKLQEFSTGYRLYCRAGEMLGRLQGVSDADKERLYTRFAALLYNVHRYTEAIDYNYRALAINERLCGELSEASFTNRRRIGTGYFTMGEYEKAYEIYKQNLTLRLENPPQSNENLGRAHMHTANALKALGRLDEALSLYGRARDYILGDEGNAIGLAMLSEELADLHSRLGEGARAREYLLEALKIYEKYSDNEEKIAALSEKLEKSPCCTTAL